MNPLAIQIQVSTQQPIGPVRPLHRRVEEDGTLPYPTGGDPDTEWLLVHETNSKPVYDGRVYDLTKQESVTTNPHPVYPNFKAYEITYGLVKRAAASIKEKIDEREREANDGILPSEKLKKLAVVVLASIVKELEGGTPTALENVLRQKIKDIGIGIVQNHQEVQSKYSQVDADIDPVIDTGWNETEI